jgi:hypothetical protein
MEKEMGVTDQQFLKRSDCLCSIRLDFSVLAGGMLGTVLEALWTLDAREAILSG